MSDFPEALEGDLPVEPTVDDPCRRSRRDVLQKIAVGGAIVWATPIITTVGNAAAAATVCVPKTLSWDLFTTGSTFNSTTIGGTTVTVGTAALSGTTLLATNRTIRDSPNGGLVGKALQFQQLPDATGIGQDITISFSEPVTDLSFTFYDIDNVTGGWGDRVSLTPTPTDFTPARTSGTRVIGRGRNEAEVNSTTGPFRNSNANRNLDDDSNRGNVTVEYDGPISSFQIRYVNAANTGGGNMRIGIGPILFCS